MDSLKESVTSYHTNVGLGSFLLYSVLPLNQISANHSPWAKFSPLSHEAYWEVLFGLCCTVKLRGKAATRRVEDFAGNSELRLKNRTDNFGDFSLALDENRDVHDSGLWLILLSEINTDFEISEELTEMQSMKGTTTGEWRVRGGNCMLDKLDGPSGQVWQ